MFLNGFINILLEIWIIGIFQKYASLKTQCSHTPLNTSQIFPGNVIPRHQSRPKNMRYAYDKLRIHFEYGETGKEITDFSKINEEILKPAKERLESLLKVKNPINGVLRLNRQCVDNAVRYSGSKEPACTKGCTTTKCLNFEVPEKFLNKCFEYSNNAFKRTGSEGEGVSDVDIVLLVEGQLCGKGMYLRSHSCFLEATLDRPIFGVLSICEGALNPETDIHHSRLMVQHELIHALGFSVDKFAYYRYQNGDPIVPRDKNDRPNLGRHDASKSFMWNDLVAQEIKRKTSSVHGTYTDKVYSLKLRNLKETAREHFKCNSIEGVDLHSFLSHFDGYYLDNEIMNPIIQDANEISKFTLALLKDTGWYDVHYSLADEYQYGKGKGCGIIFDGCYKYMNGQKAKNLPLTPFCDKVYTKGDIYKCSENRKYFQYCNVYKHKSLDKKFQYFTHLNGVPDNEVHLYGGMTDVKRFCPLMQVLSFSRSICTQPYDVEYERQVNAVKSYYGSDSACFENGISNPPSDIVYGASCQKFTFDKVKKAFAIYFPEKTINCPSKGPISFLTKNKYNVTFTCPVVEEMEKETEKRKEMEVERNNTKKKVSYKLRVSESIIFCCALISKYLLHQI